MPPATAPHPRRAPRSSRSSPRSRPSIAPSAPCVASSRTRSARWPPRGRCATASPPPPADLVLQSHTRLEALGVGRQARELMQARTERQLGVPWSALDIRTYAPDMRTPLLVAHDRDDAEVPWQDGAIIARGWPGAVLSTTGGLGHRRILRDLCVVRAATAFVTEHVPGVLAAAWEDEITASSVA